MAETAAMPLRSSVLTEPTAWFNWLTLTASVPKVPGATLVIWRGSAGVPTETVFARVATEFAPSATELVADATAPEPNAVEFVAEATAPLP